MASKAPMRLPPLQYLRVREANKAESNPCMTVMSSVLGFNTAGCAAVEDSLRACMDTRAKKEARHENINYHLTRFQKRLAGPRKYKGSKD